ncbi:MULTISPECIES: nicotinate phosphoribosyltransferase [Odoribacteraceae]|uniref:nicotinate phosphoribosyltransferase n=1 Tax=Odoribacteraceae TaxID=1853231 RepID=UPI000E53EDA3|nr:MULTISPECIES: nicotinate phosphoribosyltransferase [Odoribacteraceae]MCQ4872773.1 nicotinate phosphoribosyltransferase [Butyricimonas paravirosa]RHR82644.1 nicotinate phosphoribosyltransferase [Odoribacter sp. AF15-53]
MIIHDFLDNDLYKFTTMNAIQKKFPDSEVVYRFVNRGNTVFPPGFAAALREEVDAMADVVLSRDNERFMRAKCYYFDSVFFDLLKGFRFNPAEVTVSQDGGRLDVEIRGAWYRTVLWEVPLMAMISELYYQMTGQEPHDWERKAIEKADAFVDMGAELSEFGTRRRFSFDVQDRVIGILKENMKGLLNGTSNVYFAMKYNLTPMGTHPHEWFMYHGAHYGYRSANALALENWVDVYDGYLGIALADTYTSDNFFASFNTKYAKLFDGLRWDSGDPFEFTEKALEHYRLHRVDPRTKTVVYSDALDLEGVRKIKAFVAGRLHDVYGIGTYITNDVGVKPLNMVIKLFECRPKGSGEFLPTVKLSDVAGKHTGDPDEIDLCLRMLRLK